MKFQTLSHLVIIKLLDMEVIDLTKEGLFKDRVKIHHDYILYNDDSILYWDSKKHPNLNYSVGELVSNRYSRIPLNNKPIEYRDTQKFLLGVVGTIEVQLHLDDIKELMELTGKNKEDMITNLFLNASQKNTLYNVKIGQESYYLRESEMIKVPCGENKYLNFAML